MATPVVPNNQGTGGAVKTTSTSGLRAMSQAEAAKIQGARDANYGTNTSNPQFLTNPRVETNAQGVEQVVQPAGPGKVVEPAQALTANQGTKTEPPKAEAPKSVEAPVPPGTEGGPMPEFIPAQPNQKLGTAEKDAIAQAMGGFTDTLGGMWEKMQELYSGMSQMPFSFEQTKQALAGTPGAQPGTEPQTQEKLQPMPNKGMSAGAGTVIPSATPGQTPDTMAGASGAGTPLQYDQVAAAESRVGAAKWMPGAPSPLGVIRSGGAKAAENILRDPVASTNIEPGDDPYTSNVKELTKQLLDGQMQKDESIDQIISMMEKRKSSMEAGMLEEEDRILRDMDTLIERINHERTTAGEQIKYETSRGTMDREKNIDQMEQDNSRLFGFLQRRLAKMGNQDSAYAIASVAKYTSMATSQLSDARLELSDFRSAMASKERDIAYKAGQQMIDITNNANDAIMKGRRQIYDQMLDIDSQVLSTEIQKNESRQNLLIQLTDMENKARSTAFQETQAVKQQALQEAQFAWGQLNDMTNHARADKQLDTQIDQFNQNMDFQKDEYRTNATGNLYFGGMEAIDPKTGEPIRTIAGKSYDQQIDQWLTDVTGSLYMQGKDTGRVTFARQQFQQNYALATRGADLAEASYMTGATGNVYDPKTGAIIPGMRSLEGQSQDLNAFTSSFNNQIAKVNAGIADPASLKMFRNEYDVMSSAQKVNVAGKGWMPVSDILSGALRNAAKFVGKSGFECVQFVRSISPNLPYNLFSLADKVDAMLGPNNPNKVDPNKVQALDTIIMDMGTWTGHVATVADIDHKNRTISVIEHNIPPGKTRMKTISLDNPSIKGFWRDPKFAGGTARAAGQEQINAVTAGMPESKRENYQSILMDQLKRGDMQSFTSTVQKAAYDTMNSALRTEYDSAGLRATQFGDAKSKLEAFKGGNPGIYNKMFESSKTLAQLQQDKEYQSTLQSVVLPSIELAAELFGAAQSEPEMRRAIAGIPSADHMTFKDMENLSRGLEEFYRRKQGIIMSNATNVRPPINSRGLIDTPYGELSPEEYDEMMTLAGNQ